MNSVYAIVRQTSCDYHRIANPLRLMGVDLAAQKKIPYADALKQFPIITLNRLPHEGVTQFIERKRQHGFKTVVDIDDYWRLPETHYLYAHYNEHRIGQKLMAMIRAADYVTTTNSVLAGKISELNKNVLVIPNALPFKEIDKTARWQPAARRVRFIYAAGASHAPDVRELHDALFHLAYTPASELNGNIAEIRLAGIDDNPTHAEQWDYMRSIMSLGEMDSDVYQYTERGVMPLESYLNLYSTADVAIAPLENSLFNQCKSNLKVLEAGAYFLPIICSDVHPYNNSLDEPYVTLAKDSRDWYYYMREYTKDRNKIVDDGVELGGHVRKNYELTKVNEIRVQLYNHLLDKIR